MSQPAYVHPQDVFFDDAVCRTYDTRTHALTSGRRPISYAQIDNEYNSLMNSRHTSINIPTPLRRRRQLFCRLLRERGVTTYKGKWVVVVMKASPHPWRDKEIPYHTRFPDVPIWQKPYIHQVLTPKQIDSILRDDPLLERYFIEHWLETQHG